MADADELPFDYTHLYKTADGYSKELMSIVNKMRESTDMKNIIIDAGGYTVGEDPTKRYVLPVTKPEVPYLDFSPLQNALQKLENSVDSLNTRYQKNLRDNKISEAFNQSLYRAEQQLLDADGLPRRAWYRHTLYAPGYYTGYSVKTMPGIREAIEQRNWQEAQQQINVDAEVLLRLSKYFRNMASYGK
jgi:N-acetylated-alpha-linked acidic dipeptidase